MTAIAPSPPTLSDMAQVIRSKNAGPTQLTIDVFLQDRRRARMFLGPEELQQFLQH